MVKKKTLIVFGIIILVGVISAIVWLSNEQFKITSNEVQYLEGVTAYAEGDEYFNSTSSKEKVKTKVHDTGINISKWNNEVEMFIELPQVLNYEDLGDGKIRIYHGQTEGIFYMADENTFEWEILTSRGPNFDCITFPMQSRGLNFYYQDRLDVEENDYENCNATDCFFGQENFINRPMDIVGSVAVYHESKRNNEFGDGKALHIKRPFVYHSKGFNWLSLNITENSFGICGFDNLPNNARDLIIGPTFGYTTAGGTSSGLNLAAAIMGSNLYTASAGDTIVNYSFYGYVDQSAHHAEMGVYNTTAGGIPETRQQFVNWNPTTSEGWQHSTTTSFALDDGVVYSVALGEPFGTSDWVVYHYDSAGETGTSRNSQDDLALSWTNQFPTNRFYSLYATYETGAPPGDSCGCPGGAEWVVDCADDCFQNTTCNMRDFTLTLENSGSFKTNASLYVNNITQDPLCLFIGSNYTIYKGN